MENQREVQISAEMTPNPNTLKFNVDRLLIESGSYDFPDRAKAEASYLASELFDIAGVEGVFIGTSFITVSKQTEKMWQDLAPTLIEKLKAVLNSDKEIVSKDAVPSANDTSGSSD